MLFLTILALTVVAVNGQIIHPWEVYTLSFRSGESYSNPYKDIPLTKNGDLLKVTFKGTGEDGIKREITVIGFWNGGSEWCVNFTLPMTGNWEYMSSSTIKLTTLKLSLNHPEILRYAQDDRSFGGGKRG